MKIKSIYILIAITLLFSSCKIFKKSLKSDEYNNSVTEETKVNITIDSIQEHYSEFETFYSGFIGSYESNNKKLPLKGILKVKKDSYIWISVRPVMGIEISRILITNDSISIIDKIKNEYLEENLAIIKSKFGFNLTYKTIESILFNRFFVFPEENTRDSYFLDNNETIKTLTATGIFSDLNLRHKISFSITNFSIYENSLKLLDNNRSLNIHYSDFQILNDNEFPNSIQLNIEDSNNTSTINLTYKNIKINEKINPTFKIPDNYKPMKFE